MLRRGIPIRIQLLIISLFLVIVPVLILGTLLFDRVSREFDHYLVQSLEEETELVYGMVEREFHNLERRSERVARAIMYAARGQERLTAEDIDGLAHTLGAEVRPYAERSDADGADRLLRTVSIIGGPKLSVEISSAQTKERLLEYLGEKRIGKRGYIFVLDAESGAYRLLRGERRSTAADTPAEEERWLEGLLSSAGELEKGEIDSLHHRSAGATQERELEQAAVYTRFGPWDWVIGVNAAFADFRKGIDQVRTYLFLLTAGFLFFAFLAAYTVGRIYSRPIARLEEAVGRVGRGDLTDDVALKSSTRELLRLSRDFDRNLLDGMRKIVTDIKRVAEEIRENEEQVTRRVDGTMVETNKMSEHMASMRNKMFALDRQVGEASSAVEEIHATVQQVSGQIENQSSAVTQTSASIEQMNSSIQSVARIAEEKQQATRSLLSITENGGEKVQRTDELIREIEGSVKDVMNVISVINKVAAQTNMLAMNAAIEAAHAGDAGRGFSVVAEEIRSLSTNTSESAREISGRLKEIVERIEETTRISGETGEAFKAVSSEVHQFVDAFGEIASSTSQLSSGSREMMNVVTSLRDATTEIRDGSSEMTRGVGDINDTLQYLREYSQSAVEDLQKLNEGAKQVNASQNDLAELIVGNTRSVEGLSEEMSRFSLAGEGAEAEHSSSGLRGYLSLGILNTQRWLVELRIALDEGREAEEYPRLDDSAYAEWLERWARRRFEGSVELGRIEALYEQIRSELTELQRLASSAQGEAAERRGEQEECYLRIVEAMKEVRGILIGLRERDGESSGEFPGELPGNDERTRGQTGGPAGMTAGEQSGADGREQLEEPGYLEAVESGEPQN